MAKYSVSVKRSAIRELERLPVKVFEVIDKKIILLESEPRPSGVKKLTGEKICSDYAIGRSALYMKLTIY